VEFNQRPRRRGETDMRNGLDRVKGASERIMERLRPLISLCLMSVLVSGLVGGCAVGPNYHKPDVQIPTTFRDTNDNAPVQPQAASFADLPWWQVFQDPQLQELIRIALKQNYDLLLATERINAARDQVAITRSSLFPQVQGSANFAGGKDQFFPLKANLLELAADATFQVDLWGQLRRATQAARARLLATEEAQRTVTLTLVSDVASAYFLLLQLDLELQITKDTVETQEGSVKLTSLRLDHGVATKLDVLQAQQVLDTANAQIPDLERQIGQAEDAIHTLLGDYPGPVKRGLKLAEQFTPPEVPAGLPSSLLARRPDIRQAEQNLIAANAEIGVAKAAFFPQISLTGAGGGAFGRSSAFTSLMGSQTAIWSYGMSVAQPIFTGGALRGNLHLTESQHQQALLSYKQAIQQAFGDVSDALIGYQKQREVRVQQQQLVADLAESVRLSLMRYRGGTTNYLEVLDGQRSLFSAELTLAQAQGSEYQSLVQLYRTLGGGWQQ
jgi:multidrug efflux system outer membrane protein